MHFDDVNGFNENLGNRAKCYENYDHIVDQLIQNNLRKGDTSEVIINEYTRNLINCLSLQFEAYQSIRDPQIRGPWRDLSRIISLEMCPWNLKKFNIEGIHPLYYIIAFRSFLYSQELDHFVSAKKKSKSHKPLLEVIEQLKEIVPDYINILTSLTTLDFLPDQKIDSISELCKTWLTAYFHLDKKENLLFPISCYLPEEGRFFLCKLSSEKDSPSLKIQIFDPRQPLNGLKQDNSTPNLQTAVTFFKETTMEAQLNQLCKIFPLYANKAQVALEGLEFAQDMSLMEKCIALCKRVLLEGAEKNDSESSSPLTTMQYYQGKNSVVSSFRMLVYTLAHEAAKKDSSNANYYELKELCLTFLEIFKAYVSEKTRDP